MRVIISHGMWPYITKAVCQGEGCPQDLPVYLSMASDVARAAIATREFAAGGSA